MSSPARTAIAAAPLSATQAPATTDPRAWERPPAKRASEAGGGLRAPRVGAGFLGPRPGSEPWPPLSLTGALPAVGDVFGADLGQVVERLRAGGEQLAVAREAGVHRVAHRVQDARVGEQQRDRADVQVVLQRLVDEAAGARPAAAARRLQVAA